METFLTIKLMLIYISSLQSASRDIQGGKGDYSIFGAKRALIQRSQVRRAKE